VPCNEPVQGNEVSRGLSLVVLLSFLKDTNVLEDYYAKNRRPRPPLPAARQDMQQNRASVDPDRSDNDTQHSRQKRYSKTPKQDECMDPTQLGFYPPKWTDFLEDCKVETRTYAAVREPWPHSKSATTGFIPQAIDMTIRKWRREQRTVEKGYYPKYRRPMCKLVSCLSSTYSLALC
jgi:hypothetical protein